LTPTRGNYSSYRAASQFFRLDFHREMVLPGKKNSKYTTLSTPANCSRCDAIEITSILLKAHPINAFDPKRNDRYKNNPSDTIATCECCSDNKVRVRGTGYGRNKTQVINLTSVVVSIASDSRYNRTESATALWSVYWGPGSQQNDIGQLGKQLWEPARQTTH
jgi:hypothetical protein